MSQNQSYTLFTNLRYVSLRGVRTNTNALLLENAEGLWDERRPRLRGFGVDPAWPTFDAEPPSMQYTIIPASSHDIVVSCDDGPPKPLLTGAILRFGDKFEVQLIAMSDDKPIDVTEFPDDTTITAVWGTLPLKVAAYWNAPNMPQLQWAPADHVRWVLQR